MSVLPDHPRWGLDEQLTALPEKATAHDRPWAFGRTRVLDELLGFLAVLVLDRHRSQWPADRVRPD